KFALVRTFRFMLSAVAVNRSRKHAPGEIRLGQNGESSVRGGPDCFLTPVRKGSASPRTTDHGLPTWFPDCQRAGCGVSGEQGARSREESKQSYSLLRAPCFFHATHPNKRRGPISTRILGHPGACGM